jgi:taurine dioxygenase
MQTTEPLIRPLGGPFGAEVLGIDCAAVPDAAKPGLREAWQQYALLLFRGQELSEGDQLRFATIFGEVSNEGAGEGFNYVSNVVEDGLNPAGPLGLHFDHSFYEKPLSGLMLYALEAPPEGCGGETFFSSAKLAYRNLPPALRERIATLTIRHGWPDLSKHTELPGMDPRPDAPRYAHPLAFPHPKTGEPIVFLSRRHADCILELPRPDSDALIEELTAYVRDPAIIYTHAWRPGDLVLWDNIALQHARNNFDPKYNRHLRRVQIA